MSEASPAADAAPAVPALNIPAETLPRQDQAAAQPEATNEGEDQVKAEKPKRPASERISELYGRTRAAERERDALAAELERLRRPSSSQVPFEQLSYDDQQREIVRQTLREERAADVEAAARQRHAEAETYRALQYQERVQAAREAIPDLDAKINDPTLPISEYAAQVIAESDVGPQMAYWLANNRAEAERISRLHPNRQAFELGQIAARINAAPTARKVSQAPAPVPMVGGGGGAGAKDPAAMSMPEYIAWRRKSGAA